MFRTTRRGVCVGASVLSVGVATLWMSGAAAAKPESATATLPVAWEGTLLVQLRVADLDRAIDFYTRVLGFTLEKRNDSIQWARIKPGIPGVTIGLGVGETKGSGTASMNFGVADLAEARAAIESRGGKFLGDTVKVPGVVLLADMVDPDGNKIRLAQDITPE